MAKILCVLYPDPVTGYPPAYARDSLPTLREYPEGQMLPTPDAVSFTPGELLGSVSGGLGLRPFLEARGHSFVVTSDEEGPHSVFERELTDAEVVISQPSWPAHLSEERIAKARNLRLVITAGVGCDHVALEAARARGITVAEVTSSDSVSVAEHAVMQILALVHNFLPAHAWIERGGWNIADSVERAYDLEGMNVGVLPADPVGRAVLRRLAPFGVRLHYTDVHRLPPELEHELSLTFHRDTRSLVRAVDVVCVPNPPRPGTSHLFDRELIGAMRPGSYLVNCAHADLVDREGVVEALKSGRLAGYAGDGWDPEPPAADHPWRTMPHNAMTPHVAGSTLSAQARCAAGTREILEDWFADRPIRQEYLVVSGQTLAAAGAEHSTHRQ